MQTCKYCNETKPLSDFPVRRWKTSKGETKSGATYQCYPCQRAYYNDLYAKPNSPRKAANKRQQRDPKYIEWRMQYYRENRDKWLGEGGWRSSERAKAYDREYNARPEVAARRKLNGKAWRASNKARLVAKTRKRQTHVARATPPWVDQEMIIAFYEAAARMTVITGVKHHVDHYYPLTNKKVCGLHVPANLRVIPALQNWQKLNNLPE